MTALVRLVLLVSALALGGLCQTGNVAFGYNPLCNGSFDDANAVWNALCSLRVMRVAD